MGSVVQLHCQKCGKTMSEVNFYKYKDGSKSELCKACLTMHINNWEPDSFLWLLEKFDVPYIEQEWNVLRDRAYAKDPYKMNGMSVFGKYIAKMKLKQWNKYTWADSEKLQLEYEEKAKKYGNVNEISKEEIDNMRIAFENGEITEAQFRTYAETHQPDPNYYANPKTAAGGPGFPYPVNEHPYEVIELEDVGASLTQEDKIYLAMKWGRLYTAADWVSLEQMYNEYLESFDIQDAGRSETLKMICKTTLKMNNAIDSGDIESYQKLSRVYDSMMKSAKFTEAQKKDSDSNTFDSIGELVAFCEKEGGQIPKYEITYPQDIIDKVIMDLKQYTHSLITQDAGLAQQIEQYIKRKEIAEEQKKNRQQAMDNGDYVVEIEDEDIENYYNQIEEERLEDEKLYEEV